MNKKKARQQLRKTMTISELLEHLSDIDTGSLSRFRDWHKISDMGGYPISGDWVLRFLRLGLLERRESGQYGRFEYRLTEKGIAVVVKANHWD